MSTTFTEFENRLRDRLDHEATADLRDRVMTAIGAELARPAQSSARRWDNQYWAAVAAGVLIVLNVSMVWASHDEYSVSPAHGSQQMTAEIQAIRQLEMQQEGIFK
jgi:hypothetical protein